MAAETHVGDVIYAWQHDEEIPKGWEIDVDTESEGGQVNRLGKMTTTDDYGSYQSETHHRTKQTITIWGPWQEGPTDYARRVQEGMRANRAAEEDRILERAAQIQAQRAKEIP